MDELYTAREVEGILRVSKRTLIRWRMAGKGPRWIRLEGEIRYPRTDLEAYMEGAR